MKKFFLTAVLLVLSLATSFAQFEKGKMYVGASFNGAGISYSDLTKLKLEAGANVGYMFEDNLMAIGEVGFDYSNKDLQTLSIGAKCRYFIQQNGVFLQAGAKYLHNTSYNDFQLTPEVGYCFFLNSNITIEPSAFYDMSLTKFGDRSKAGIKIGLGWYF